MSYRSNIVYRYDGSFNGFLCCVFEAFEKREIPAFIESVDEPQETLFPRREIDTDTKKALRVMRSIPLKISEEALELMKSAFLSCASEKELYLLKFLMLGYREGKRTVGLVENDSVDFLLKAARQTENEAHLIKGFLRFSDSGGFLASQIAPKNNILPLLAEHFCGRFPAEDFLIWDKVHCVGLVHEKNGGYRFFRADKVDLPDPDENEVMYRNLWKSFYNTIAIAERYNPGVRMTHMPKRFWGEMTEMKSEV